MLEPIYADFRRIKFRETSGQFTTIHIDEVVDKLLRDEHFCEVMLPRIPKRWVLEEANKLKKGRASALE
jgi:pre-mRNA-splicing factor 38A